MQWLSQIVKNVVGDVDYVVDGFQAQGTKKMLQPLGGGLDLNPSKHNPRIARAIGSLVYDDLERRARRFHMESRLYW
jgi:hypothetical protein